MTGQIGWGSPHKHHPMIGGIQFHLNGAYGSKDTAERVAKKIRKDGLLARIQKRPASYKRDMRGRGYVWVVFWATPHDRR